MWSRKKEKTSVGNVRRLDKWLISRLAHPWFGERIKIHWHNRDAVFITYSLANFIFLIVLVITNTYFLPVARAGSLYQASAELGQSDENGNQLFSTLASDNANPSSSAFNSPDGEALDSVHHRLFVTDRGNSRVLVFNLSSTNSLTDRKADYVLGQSNFTSNSTNLTQSGMTVPISLSYDSVGNRLFVADEGYNRVLVFDLSGGITNGMNASYVLGEPDFVTGPNNTSQSGMFTPIGTTYDASSSRLFVSDSNNNRVLVFDLSGGITNGMNASYVLGQPDFTSRTSSVSQSSLSSPHGLSYDSGDKFLFVSDFGSQRVLVFDLSGGITNGMNASYVLGEPNFTTNGQPISQGNLGQNYDVYYISASKRLFVADVTNNRVMVYNLSGGITNGMNASYVLGQPDFTSSIANTSRNGMSRPAGFAYDDTNQELFVTDNTSNRVLIYDLSGGITNGMNASDIIGQTDSSGNPVYTTSNVNNKTVPNNGGMDHPASVSVDNLHHRLFVADTGNNRVLVYNLDSQDNISGQAATYVLGQPDFTSLGSTGPSQQITNQPYDTAYDSVHNRLFVADANNNRILVYDLSGGITNGMNASYVLGQPDFTSGASNTTQAYISTSYNIDYDSTDNLLFATDYYNNRVLIYNLAGGISNGMNASYVLGQPDFTSSGWGITASALNSPYGVRYDSAHHWLFVADNGNYRILVYDLSGGITNGMNASYVLGQPDFTSSNSTATSQNTLTCVDGLAYDSSNQRLFVSDYCDSRVVVYTLSGGISNGMNASAVVGQSDFSGNVSDAAQGKMSAPLAISYDSFYNRLFVADQNNNRVLQFNLAKLTAASLPSGTVGASYSTALTTSDTQGTVSLSLASGTLPPGIAFNATSGVLSGKPTAAGTYNFSIKLSDNNGTLGTFFDTVRYSLVIGDQTVAPSTSSNGTSGHPATTTPTASGPTSTTAQASTDSGTTVKATVDLNTFIADSSSQASTQAYSTVLSSGQVLTFSLDLPASSSASGTSGQSSVQGSTNSTSGGSGSASAAVRNEVHSLTINQVSKDKVTFTLASTPKKYTLGLHQQTRADINEDGHPDVGILVASITPPTVNLKIWKIATPAPTKLSAADSSEQAQRSLVRWLTWVSGIDTLVPLLAVVGIKLYKKEYTRLHHGQLAVQGAPGYGGIVPTVVITPTADEYSDKKDNTNYSPPQA